MRAWTRWGLILTGAWVLNILFVFYYEPAEWHVPVACIVITCAQNWAILYCLRDILEKL